DRGAIVVQGTGRARSIAVSVKSHNRYEYQRKYPHGPDYAHLTGYFTRGFGLGGVEASENDLLAGDDSSLFLHRVVDLVDNQQPRGGTVSLTVNPAAQQAAWDGLHKLGAHVR